MPTYEYGCNSCGEQFEVFQSITAEPISICQKCGEPTAQRLISGGAGLLFKGSGFYITDYRSKDYKEKAKSESAPAASTDSSSTASSTASTSMTSTAKADS